MVGGGYRSSQRLKHDDHGAHSVPTPQKSWQVVTAAVLNGGDFKDPTIAHLASRATENWMACQELCAANVSCTAFDHVGASIPSYSSARTQGSVDGISEGECWFRLDGLWNPHTNHKRNHTSGHLVSPPAPEPAAPPGAKNVLFIIFDVRIPSSLPHHISTPHRHG